MSKNALVLVDHFGDDGMAPEGRILLDVSNKRFEQLEKKGLVREATAEEVEAGDQIQFEKDNSADLAPVDEEKGEDASAADKGDDKDEKKAAEPDNKKAADPKNKAA